MSEVQGKSLGPFSFVFVQVLKHWNGNAPLWSAFWIFTVLGKISLFLIVFLYLWAVSVFGGPQAIHQMDKWPWVVFVLCYLGYLIGSWVMLWRCAPNVKFTGWFVVTRIFVFLCITSFVVGILLKLAE